MPQFITTPLPDIEPVELTDGTMLDTPELTRIVERMKAVRAGGMVNMISRTDVVNVMLLLGWEEEAEWLGDKAFRGRRTLNTRERVPYFELLNCLGGE